MTDSPVAALATIRAMLFRCGAVGDVVSSIDITTAFLQANPYDDGIQRFVYYQAYPGAEKEFYELTGPIYGQRAASLKCFETLREWLVKDMGFVEGKNEPCVFVKNLGRFHWCG